MIVVSPAFDCLPLDRLKLRLGHAQRAFGRLRSRRPRQQAERQDQIS
jgi:hypothetical protein